MYPGEAAFDPLNQSYPNPGIISINGTYTSKQTGIVYEFPGYINTPSPNMDMALGTPDNVICEGQIISEPKAMINDRYFSASMLVSSDVELSTVSGTVTYTYTDGSTQTSELRSLPWFAFLTINRGEIIFPYRYTTTGINYNTSHIFEYTAALNPTKQLRSITLPNTTDTTTGRLHVFSVSLWKGQDQGHGHGRNLSAAAAPHAQVQFVRPTQKWTAKGSQVIEVTINNPGSKCISGKGLTISIAMDGIHTVEPGHIKRLCPGDQKRVNIGVNGESNGTATILIDDGIFSTHQQTFTNIAVGLKEWTSDLGSLSKHESPVWFDDSKFGILIHWGPYSVPAWGNSSSWESYVEWFW